MIVSTCYLEIGSVNVETGLFFVLDKRRAIAGDRSVGVVNDEEKGRKAKVPRHRCFSSILIVFRRELCRLSRTLSFAAVSAFSSKKHNGIWKCCH